MTNGTETTPQPEEYWHYLNPEVQAAAADNQSYQDKARALEIAEQRLADDPDSSTMLFLRDEMRKVVEAEAWTYYPHLNPNKEQGQDSGY